MEVFLSSTLITVLSIDGNCSAVLCGVCLAVLCGVCLAVLCGACLALCSVVCALPVSY